MSAANGYTNGFGVESAPALANGHSSVDLSTTSALFTDPQETIKVLLEALQIPFDPSLVKWRATETQRMRGRLHGFVLPYADPRAYKDRLNLLLTPVGWTDKYAITTTATKVLVTCELNIQKLGFHSATGEEWSRNENAATAAEAQAFKRACACFGLGRYFYFFEGRWLELDGEKRPVTAPEIPEWATPDGWKRGLRPSPATPAQPTKKEAAAAPGTNPTEANFQSRRGKNVVRDIFLMEPELGPSLYRGLLKSIARVWDPGHIREIGLQHTVLAHMESARRGLRRAAAAAAKLERATVIEILRSLDIDSLEKVTDLHTLQTIVLALERSAGLV